MTTSSSPSPPPLTTTMTSSSSSSPSPNEKDDATRNDSKLRSSSISADGAGGLKLSPSFIDHKAAIPLIPVVKDYAWGIRGYDSRVGRYALQSGSLQEIDPDVPYAELWIGTHSSGHALLQDGRRLSEEVGGELPFLFKILSAGKALSIQAHPDKKLAELLHRKDPQHYKDQNHKPEMAIALTPFEAMCGFRRIEEISVLLKKHAEFAACISQDAKLAIFLADSREEKQAALQSMFESFMTCPSDVAEEQLELLLTRLQLEESSIHPHPHDLPSWERKCARAIIRLSQQFPKDPGAMAPLFLNYLLMAPGESFFMAANEPHAYVAGEIIECMACSDNVVRAGLTPKYKDVETLVSMLSYSQGGPSIDAGCPLESDSRILRYTPPVPEFEVLILTCNPGDSIELEVKDTPCIFLIVEGTGFFDGNIICRPGRSYYHPAEAPPIRFHVPEEKRGPLKVAVAHENLHLEIPTTYKRSSVVVPPTPFVSPTVFRGANDNLKHLAVNEYDYEM